MEAYLCVYRKRQVSEADWQNTDREAEHDSDLRRFLGEYDEGFYDWGDDPSFFAASQRNGTGAVTWGVCRRDVRSALSQGDAVVFFCACQDNGKTRWDYYFVGVGVVQDLVRKRGLLWTDPKYRSFRNYHNVLVNDRGALCEKFYPFHEDDWKDRAAAPYIIFDPKKSKFNLSHPELVARWKQGSELPERWLPKPRVCKIERLLFTDRGIGKEERRLRTSKIGFGHAKLNLGKKNGKPRPGLSLPDLVESLKAMV